MKRFSIFLIFTIVIGLTAQTPSMRSCGLRGSHKCECLKHVSEVQDQYMKECLTKTTVDSPREALQACMKAMPEHCNIVEHYGSWSTGPDGEHDAPMPQQCTSACKRGHCHCADGPMCHFAHSPEEDK